MSWRYQEYLYTIPQERGKETIKMAEHKSVRIYVDLDTGEMLGCEGGLNRENIMYCKRCPIRGYCQLRLIHIFNGGEFYEELAQM